jgi:hypothetical protein
MTTAIPPSHQVTLLKEYSFKDRRMQEHHGAAVAIR